MELNSEDDDDGDNNIALLECIDPQHTPADIISERDQTVISTAEINTWDLPTLLAHQTILIIRANRNRLLQHSSYFRGLLSGSFRESSLDSVTIHWNRETILNVLKCIFGCPVEVTSDNFLLLLEGALFFGVEVLLLKCKTWLIEVTSFKGFSSPQLDLDTLIHIWKFGMEHANDFIPEICTGYLARNFMQVLSCNSFGDMPYDLFVSCLKHPLLTVDSERHVFDAVLLWFAADADRRTKDDCTNIFKEIRINLLPLWFIAGRRKCSCISMFVDESINAILTLVKVAPARFINVLGDNDWHHFRIRLTEFTENVHLSGCAQLKPAILLLSMLPCSYVTDPLLRKSLKQSLNDFVNRDNSKIQIPWGSWPSSTFEAVREVDISNCPFLHLETAIECFSKSFPSLRTLKAAYFLNFKATKLGQLVQRFPLLSEIDLTVDISPVIPAKVSIVSSSFAKRPKIPRLLLGTSSHPSASTLSYIYGQPSSNITKLTLEGRLDVTDADLQNFSEFCVSLCYLNIKGCLSLTDAGISVLVRKCTRLHSIVACDTSFGQISMVALLSGVQFSDSIASPHAGNKHCQSSASELQMLHIGGCEGINDTSLSELLAQAQMLRSLCLRETLLAENTLYSFIGSSLVMLDVSDTKVSGTALAHVICRNPDLKCLKARGCKNLLLQESIHEMGKLCTFLPSCDRLFVELAKLRNLEEIALGWGSSLFSLEALKPASAMLRALTVGLGGSLGQDGLQLLPKACPFLESLVLYFQVISDSVIVLILEGLKCLQVLALCYCVGEISSLSFKSRMPNLRKLRLERVTPWMTNNDLVVLAQNCVNLIELSLLGCTLLNPESQEIISCGWPGLISIHLEECGQVTINGVTSLLDCLALEDLLLRHNGAGIQRNFILDAASKMSMLRKISLDTCDARDGDFEIPSFDDRKFLSNVKIARCKLQRCPLGLQNLEARRMPLHKESLILEWDSKNMRRTVIKERL